MKKKSQHNGISLVELLVSIVILFVMMIGVAAVDQAIKRTHSTSSRSSQTSLGAAAAMMHIVNNAALTVGSRVPVSSLGIVVSAPSTNMDPWILRVRQDRNNTPFDYSDDIWVRYWSANDGILNVCMDWDVGDGSCATAQDQFVLANNLVFSLTSEQFKFVTPQSAATAEPELYLEVNLSTLYNIMKPEDPITNPRTDLSTLVHMPGHTWSQGP